MPYSSCRRTQNGPAAVLVASLRDQVQVVIVRAQQIDAAGVGGIGVKHVARVILEEDADAFTLGGFWILTFEIVYRAFCVDFVRRERDVIVEVEIGPV